MKLISYTATRPGFQGLGSIIVRLGTNSPFSHTEIVFEPGDGVDHLMPDGTTEPDADGALWCASATASDVMPVWSKRRQGRKGGVRFKRIVVGSNWFVQNISHETCSPVGVAQFIKEEEGLAYDWKHIAGFLGPVFNLIFSHGAEKYTCSEICAAAMGMPHAHRFQPGNLPAVIAWSQEVDPLLYQEQTARLKSGPWKVW